MKDKVNIFWFRRDLRIDDNVSLYHALSQRLPVLPIFIFDENILNQLENKSDRRVDFIHQALENINQQLKLYKSSILIKKGNPISIFKDLETEYDIQSIFCNEDYESYSITRDLEISKIYKLKSYQDHVIFRYDQILKKDKTPYTVFTPYSKQWKLKLNDITINKLDANFENFLQGHFQFPTLETIGFNKTEIEFHLPKLEKQIITNYKENRDFPFLDATSKIGIHLRFGTISIRECVRFALENNSEIWLNELIWREFFIQILSHFPQSAQQSFKIKYDNIQWRNDESEFEVWCKGKTGYPIVDAGMRELNQTGYMHNRVRMIVASFLCKHLLIDWRWGESYFANHLNDYENASNVGNWQWAASTGCDAVPYFRVFNPTLQQQKFDPNDEYIKKWISDFDPNSYIKPIVEHDYARKRAIDTYKDGINNY